MPTQIFSAYCDRLLRLHPLLRIFSKPDAHELIVDKLRVLVIQIKGEVDRELQALLLQRLQQQQEQEQQRLLLQQQQLQQQQQVLQKFVDDLARCKPKKVRSIGTHDVSQPVRFL